MTSAIKQSSEKDCHLQGGQEGHKEKSGEKLDK